MTDYQKIRAAIEGPLLTVFNSLVPPVPVYFDNVTFVPPDPPGEYVRVNMTFGMMTEESLAGSLDRARGALVIRCFAEKNKGPARVQELVSIAVSVLKQIGRSEKQAAGVFVKVCDISGPSFPMERIEQLEPGQSSLVPHFQARVEASWMGSVLDC